MAATIAPHLWFDKEAREAAAFYAALFPGSAVDHVATLRNTPSGDCDVVSFHLAGHPFLAISAGPLFKPNPSISFILNHDPSRDRDARRNLDAAWEKLAKGGSVLLPLQEYPFSKRYGWVQDRYGVSWQLILSDPAGEPRPFLVPSLLFTGKSAGRAEEAIEHYVRAFPGSRRGATRRHPKGMAPDKEGTLLFADFQLQGQWFAAMDSAQGHGFAFNEAISLLVRCRDQREIDTLWAKLSAVPEAEQCGWLKDRFGVSWQIAPAEMDDMLRNGTPEQVDRVTQAFLPMKKFDLDALRRAYAGPARKAGAAKKAAKKAGPAQKAGSAKNAPQKAKPPRGRGPPRKPPRRHAEACRRCPTAHRRPRAPRAACGGLPMTWTSSTSPRGRMVRPAFGLA